MAAAETLDAQLTAKGFAKLVAFVDVQAAAPPAHAEVGATAYTLLHEPDTTPSQIYDVAADGSVTVPHADLPALDAGARGLWSMTQFTEPYFDPESNKRSRYEYHDRERLRSSLTLEPLGRATEKARVEFRQALPSAYVRETARFAVRPAMRVRFATALQDDWRADRESGARFTVRLCSASGEDVIFDETRFVWKERFEEPAWHTHDIDLTPWAGREATLVFETAAPPNTPQPTLAFPLWGNPLLYVSNHAAANTPSLLLISLDTLRADRLGCYGYSRDTSPNLDAFARDSVLFEEARAQASMTTPVHASIFTGESPAVHRAGIFSEGFVLRDTWPVLAERFADAGYLTTGVTEGVAIRGNLGFRRGFDRYDDGPNPGAPKSGVIADTYDKAFAWLDRLGRFPFFLFLHTYEIHAPYAPPAHWREAFITETIEDDRGGVPAHDIPVSERAYYSQAYDACIAHTDAWFGRLMDACRNSGLLDRAWVIVLSDHGEEFWEHGRTGHALTLYEEQLRVPLIVRPPGGLEAGKRVLQPVLLTDVFDTIAEIFSFEDADAAHSLVPLLRDDSERTYPRESFFAYYQFPDPDADPLPNAPQPEQAHVAVKTGDWKHLIGGPVEQSAQVSAALPSPLTLRALYNLSDDPGEQASLESAAPARAAAFENDIASWYQGEVARWETNRPANDGAGLDAEDVEALRAMGYL